MHIYRQSLQQKNCFWRNKNLFEIRYLKLGCAQKVKIVRLNLIKLLCVHWKYWREQCILYACFRKVSIAEIGSSIMPGVKMLRQNFVSASNKSPKDKRLRLPKISPVFFNYFQKSFCIDYKEGAGFLPDDTLSHVKKTNLLSRCNRCTTLSNLKKEKEMNNQIHLRFLLKQPQCKVINSFYCSQLDCDNFLR